MKSTRPLVAVVAAGAAVALAACGTPSSGGGTSSDGGTTVVWDMWASGESDVEALEAQLAIAREENPDIDIQLKHAPWDDYFTKLTTNLASGDVACVTSMNGQRLSGYHEAFLPLTEEELATAGIDPDDFAAGSFDIMSHEGTLYGIPYDVAAMLVYYNKDMFAETGTPEPEVGWSFDDFDAAAEGTTTDEHHGFGMSIGEFQWMSLPIARSGKQPVDESGALALDDPDFADAAEWYVGIADKGFGSVPPSAAETGWGELEYQAGNVAMAIDGTWNAATYLGNEAGFDAGMVDLPSQDGEHLGLVLGSGYGISADCADKEAALEVLGSLVGEDAQNLIASSGRSYPARTSSQPLYFDSLDEGVRDEVEATFEAAFTGVQGQRSTDEWAQINEAMSPQLISVYTGDTTIGDVLGQTQQQFGE